MEKKITEKMILTAVMEVAEKVDFGTEVTPEDVIAFCQKKINQAEAKAEKAKAKRAEKTAENDELINVIAKILTDEYQTAQEIADAAKVTKGKAVNRLARLIEDGFAEKATKKIGDTKVMCYKKAQVDEEEMADSEE